MASFLLIVDAKQQLARTGRLIDRRA